MVTKKKKSAEKKARAVFRKTRAITQYALKTVYFVSIGNFKTYNDSSSDLLVFI